MCGVKCNKARKKIISEQTLRWFGVTKHSTVHIYTQNIKLLLKI